MITPYQRAPHQGGTTFAGVTSPHAALLIDFDNVTMGMRSDLSKELKNLLSSDVIKGKVSVQRAYADWRRYPQYIVPLSEASVDLIFAPAYGSSKKNATDIRMAIDALELVFIRPEIGTYILLTGDSDFSSLVLKLKEYGKYVVGVGIQESSSDILVQNCDEYYSYTSLTGLTKTTDLKNRGSSDPWVLVKEAVAKMVSRDDVMRSDRLKQVMQEIDPSFDEGAIGFSKFSKFLSEAASRGLVKLRKLDNGQYEIEAPQGARGGSRTGTEGERGRSRDRRGRGRGRERRDRDDESGVEVRDVEGEAPPVLAAPDAAGDEAPVTEASPVHERAVSGTETAAATGAANSEDVTTAISVLTETLERLARDGRASVRDSDVKRKILETHPDFDEGVVGFAKFSRFLAEAETRGAIVITRQENGSSEVSLPDTGTVAVPAKRERQAAPVGDTVPDGAGAQTPVPQAATPEPTVIEVRAPKDDKGLKLGPRRGSTRRRSGGADDVVPLFEGQTVPAGSVTLGSGAGASAPAEPPVASEATPSADHPPATSGATLSGDHPPATDRAPVAKSGRGGRGRTAAAEKGGKERKAQPTRSERAEAASPSKGVEPPASAAPGAIDLKGLGLPSDPEAIVRYMTHRYKGVGEKTAETLVERFGVDTFGALRDRPGDVRDAVPGRRGEQVLEAWAVDYGRRTS